MKILIIGYKAIKQHDKIIVYNIAAYFYAYIEQFNFDYNILHEMIINYLNNKDIFYEEMQLNNLYDNNTKVNYTLLRTKEKYEFFDSYIDRCRLSQYKEKIGKNKVKVK